MNLGWMAWTWETGIFFCSIVGLLVCMTLWELRAPGGAPRRGILAIDTTRGDRLFISLLCSAFIHLGWLGLLGSPLWGASAISIAAAIAIFRWV
jgi:predicted small integral membrane protein